MKRPLDQLAEIAQKAVHIGEQKIKSTRPQRVSEKTDRDTFTNVDVEIEHAIRQFLAEATPEIPFSGEEKDGKNPNHSHGWFLDPIDGTANYVHGIPLCATQLAFIDHGTVTVATVSLPYHHQTYWAIKGQGSFRDGEQIRVSHTKELKNSIVSTGDFATGPDSRPKNNARVAMIASLAEHVERVRMLGSAAHDLAWVADGRIDATVIMSNNLIDIGPGVLIASEAGAIVSDVQGDGHDARSTSVLVAAPGIAKPLLDITTTVVYHLPNQ